MNRIIAFFDFDGTVTKKDSLLEFIKYSKGSFSFYAGFLLHSPILILYKLQLFPNQLAKEMIIRFFFRKMPLEDFNKNSERFSSEMLPSLIRPKALKEIRKLQEEGAEVVIVSASPENWIEHWCRPLGIKCIASRLKVNDNKITGKIEGLNCHGEEKARRIREIYNLDTFSTKYCYGDTSGDKPMLSLGDYRFYKPFR